MEKNVCVRWEALHRLYAEEGEAAPLGRHVRECAACQARAEEESPEALFALLGEPPPEFFTPEIRAAIASIKMPWELEGWPEAERRRRENRRRLEARGRFPLAASWTRRAAALALAAGLGWAGYWLHERASRLPATMPSGAAPVSASPEVYPPRRDGPVSPEDWNDLRARYPLVHGASTPHYTVTLAGGTRMVYFHVPEL